jgi:hypothetical protein
MVKEKLNLLPEVGWEVSRSGHKKKDILPTSTPFGGKDGGWCPFLCDLEVGTKK